MSPPEFLALQAALGGRFILDRELGRGGMGIVFLARDTALERPVAIKLLPALLAADPDLRQRFLQEARTAARLGHPHIVPIHSVEEHGDQVCFVMAYVPGKTLAQRVRDDGPLPPGEVARIVCEIAWALAYAHQQGVVHRDVKPENILLERTRGRAMITDFGIAQVASAATRTPAGTPRGTIRYMSPEQAEGQPVDGRSDLYSLGLTAQFALTGRVPYESESPAAVLLLKATGSAPPMAVLRSDTPSALANIIDRCLSADPARRFPTAESLAEALGELHDTSASPPVLQRLAQEISAVGVDIGGFGSLAIVALIAAASIRDFFGFETFYALGLCTLMVGLIGLRAMTTVRLLREANQEGWELRDLEAAARKGIPPVTRPEARRYTLSRLAIWGGVMTALTLFWLGPRNWSQVSDVSILTWIVELFSLGAPVAAGRWLAGSLERRPDGQLGPFTRFFLRFKAGMLLRLGGLGTKGQKRSKMLPDQPTEVVLADQARALLGALPAAGRAQVDGAGDLLARLLKDAIQLRGRLGEIDAAAAAVGPPDGAGREQALAEIASTRAQVLGRLSLTIQALEQLRLDLLRAKAGVAGGEGLTEDLAQLMRLSQRLDEVT